MTINTTQPSPSTPASPFTSATQAATGTAYLDYSASAPLRPEVADAMAPWLVAGAAGNPSSVHRAGRRARAALEDARDQIADALGVHPLNVLFTSGATEANNLAIAGAFQSHQATTETRPHVVAGALDHPSIIEPLLHARRQDQARLLFLTPPGVGEEDCGLIGADLVGEAIRPDTALVVGTVVTSELGSIQPVDDWLATIASADQDRGPEAAIWTHLDGTQAIGKCSLNGVANRCASFALSAHKVGGPQGIGVLIVDRGREIVSPILGGGQERGIRSGTIPVALCVGAAMAIDQAINEQATEMVRLGALKDRFLAGIEGSAWVPTVARAHQVPTVIHLTTPDTDSEAVIMALDRAGVYVSAGTACQSGAIKTSPLVEAINIAPHTATLRLSMGWATTQEDVDLAARALGRVPVGNHHPAV